jgi:GTP-binding protein
MIEGASDSAIFDDDTIEAARIAFAREARFTLGAVQMAGLPDTDLPEVAFAGRSNVGKSSLINALVGQHRLARASNAPGRTREINFFVVDDILRLVDLPGYGFARAARTEVQKFQNLGRDYLRGRPNLKRAYLLIDSRHGLKDVDKEALDAFDVSAVSYQVILTKADKITAPQARKLVDETLKLISRRPAAFPRVLATSAEKGTGMPQLRAEIMLACGLAQEAVVAKT